MPLTSIHQTIHGYREGHRLLSSSLPLNNESARTMLVLSDMSGPVMQPGFDEYLTGYPLPNTNYYVFAKTWHATEMQRPGCVWTHSLLISREQISQILALRLLTSLQRPKLEGVENSATSMIVLDDMSTNTSFPDIFPDLSITAALIRAVIEKSQLIIVPIDSVKQIEAAFLKLWDMLWSIEKARFSFCTGALNPRTIAGIPMDIQAVPRMMPSSQFRKNASSTFILNLNEHVDLSNTWVEEFFDDAPQGDKTTFRSWMELVAGAEVSRSTVPILLPIFERWNSVNWSPRNDLESIVCAVNLEPATRMRLSSIVFERAVIEQGSSSRRKLLLYLCAHRDAGLFSMRLFLEDQTCRLFDESREEGCIFVQSLLKFEFTNVIDQVLQAAVRLLVPNDLEFFRSNEPSLLPTIVSANPSLATSPVLWKQVGSQSTEILSQLNDINLNDDERRRIVDAVLSTGRIVPIEALVRFGGKLSILRILTAVANEQIHYSWKLRSVLSAQPNFVLEWLETYNSLTPRELLIGTRLLTPHKDHSRLAKVWKDGTVNFTGTLTSRVAAFGLALALIEGSTQSVLLASCFQPTYDAVRGSRLEEEEWDWLRDQAPPVSFWRSWDKCERLVAALARLLVKKNVSLETFFLIVGKQQTIRKISTFLDDDIDMRSYLKALRSMVGDSNIGTQEQREALLEN